MSNPVFQPTNFESMVHLVVGQINELTGQDRWEKETPLFIEAISRHVNDDTKVVLDYGCGVGRLAKGMLARHNHIELLGVDDSAKQLDAALAYVNDQRFETLLPTELNRTADLIYCIYVLQHLPAIELREALQRMHYFLKPGGTMIFCSSEGRMAIRFDKPAFLDDRFLGVNLKKEVERFFEKQGDLFTAEEIAQNEILQRMILGQGPAEISASLISHPAYIYKRKDIEGPLFNVPLKN